MATASPVGLRSRDVGTKLLTAQLSQLKKELIAHSDDSFKKLSRELSKFENQLNKIESVVSELETKLVAKIEAEVEVVNNKVRKLEDKIISIESQLQALDKRCCEIDEIRLKVHNDSNLKEKEITSDAVIFGIPFISGESLKSVFNLICHNINFQPPQIKDVFRIKPKTSEKHGLVIIKFFSPYDRNRVLKAFGDFRRQNHSAVSFQPEWMDVPVNIFIHESLKPDTRKLLQAAIIEKRNKKIFNVFSLRGVIHVRLHKGSESISISSLDELQCLISKSE